MSKKYIVIPNWEKFQSRDVWRKSGGRPPWIKNYTQLLHKDEYMSLTLTERGLLHGIWMLYASTGEVLSTDLCRSLLCPSKATSRSYVRSLARLNDAGLIEILSRPEESREEEIRKTLASDYQSVDNPRRALELLKGGNEEERESNLG